MAQPTPDLPVKEQGIGGPQAGDSGAPHAGDSEGPQAGREEAQHQAGAPARSMIAQTRGSPHPFPLQLYYSHLQAFLWHLPLESTKEEQSRRAGWEDVLELCSLPRSHWRFPGTLLCRQWAGYRFSHRFGLCSSASGQH